MLRFIILSVKNENMIKNIKKNILQVTDCQTDKQIYQALETPKITNSSNTIKTQKGKYGDNCLLSTDILLIAIKEDTKGNNTSKTKVKRQ
jgi:hypothetical protein